MSRKCNFRNNRTRITSPLQEDLRIFMISGRILPRIRNVSDKYVEKSCPIIFTENRDIYLFININHFILYIQPLKMELIEGSETSANNNRAPGKYPKEYIQYSKHGESLKARIHFMYFNNQAF